MGSPVIFKGDYAKLLPNGGIEFRDGKFILTGTADPEGLVEAPPGSIYIQEDGSNIGKAWLKESSNLSVGWVPMVTTQYSQLTKVLLVDEVKPQIDGFRYQTIQSAIAYAVSQSPSSTDPWTVFVGASSENITLAPWVYIQGLAGSYLTGDISVSGNWAGGMLDEYLIKNCVLDGEIILSGFDHRLVLEQCTTRSNINTASSNVGRLYIRNSKIESGTWKLNKLFASNCMVMGGNFPPHQVLGSNIEFMDCIFEDTTEFTGGIFKRCHWTTESVTINTGTYYFYGCVTKIDEWILQSGDNYTIVNTCNDFPTNIETLAGSQLTLSNSYNFEVDNIGGITINNRTAYFDPKTSGLTSSNEADAIRELASNMTSTMIYKGSITLPADFPDPGDVQNGWFYTIAANVTDNDPTKTNTGQSFIQDDEIVWNGTDWTVVGTRGVNESNIYYIGKHGDDANNGKSIEKAKLTFTNAIATAVSGDTIVCFDEGTYTESITTKSGVNIYAPNANFVASSGNAFVVNDNVNIKINKVTVGTGSAAFGKFSGSGVSTVECNEINVVNGQGIFTISLNTGLEMVCKVKLMTLGANAKGIQTIGGKVQCDIDKIYLQGNSAIGVQASNGNIIGRIGEIIENGSYTSTVGLDIDKDVHLNINLITADTCIDVGSLSFANLYVGEIVGTVAYTVSVNAKLNLFTNKLTGTETNNGVTKLINLSGGSSGQVIKTDSSGNVNWGSDVGGGFPFVVVDAAGGFDYTNIDTAVNTEPANTMFFVKSGSYTTNNLINMKAGQVLIGESRDGVQWTIVGGVNCNDDNKIQGFTLIRDASLLRMFDIQNKERVTFRENYFDCTAGYAIWADQALEKLYVEDCVIDSGRALIGLGALVQDVYFVNCTILSGTIAIGAPPGKNINILNCRFNSTISATGTGQITVSSLNNEIIGLNISNCVFEDVTQTASHGIMFQSSNGDYIGVHIDNCYFNNITGYGIIGIDTVDATIENSHFYSCNIGIFMASGNALISNCVTSNNTVYGIHLDTPVDRSIVSSCKVLGNGTQQIRDDGTNNVLANNITA